VGNVLFVRERIVALANFAKDKAKFGGPNRKKQYCALKQCLQVGFVYLIIMCNIIIGCSVG